MEENPGTDSTIYVSLSFLVVLISLLTTLLIMEFCSKKVCGIDSERFSYSAEESAHSEAFRGSWKSQIFEAQNGTDLPEKIT